MVQSNSRRLAPAVTLFFVAPFVAEFLLGNLPITLLPALTVLAPLYGGGAILARELVRRSGRGWPSILLLGIAYGVIEEAFTTQSLFNPDYLHLHLGLLKPAYIAPLGIGAWWTLFVLTLHAGWSICTSIALVEALWPRDARTRWLGVPGVAITALLFLAGAAASAKFTYQHDHFLASRAQFVSAALVCVALVAAAYRLPKTTPPRASYSFCPGPWLVGGVTLLAGSALLLTPMQWGWGAAALIAAIDTAVIIALWIWSRAQAWDIRRQLAAAAGAALAYGWHAFIETPAAGSTAVSIVRAGNAVFLVIACVLIYWSTRKIRLAQA